MSAGNNLGHRWGRNGEFCVVVSPVPRNAGILAYYMLPELGLSLAGLKVIKRMSSFATDFAVSA